VSKTRHTGKFNYATTVMIQWRRQTPTGYRSPQRGSKIFLNVNKYRLRTSQLLEVEEKVFRR